MIQRITPLAMTNLACFHFAASQAQVRLAKPNILVDDIDRQIVSANGQLIQKRSRFSSQKKKTP
ncbi:hypothetical protein LF844_13830 [Metapseudomonas lalkuanensis]|uniref:hypothetical protein n=1 Tax=Pseudomonadaceae TaxID=135621 RepID=UPI001CF5E7E3|nr:hypothetical protein [Pseudomonas lalkuanensis]UCP00829.1 hypothetical protein LF844_13830 [Pseudomonas lalkuanensis]